VIRIIDLSVVAGNFHLNNINLEINPGEYFIIVGPAGAGKTVLIETIAGLRRVKSGGIWLNDVDITGLIPEKRGIGIVYQDQVLFPHLNVKENVTFGLKMRGIGRNEVRERLDWITRVTGIKEIIERYPITLSGGERQKVALARALSVKPEVLLLDEPLSALDPETRENMQEELRKLHRGLGTTFIHVTHDFEEAAALGDRIAVINRGMVEQVGTPEEIFRQPASLFVARFTMGRNIFPGMSSISRDGRASFRTGSLEFFIATENTRARYALVRPEDILISREPPDKVIPNSFNGKIGGITNKGATAHISVNVPPEFCCLVTRRDLEQNQFKKGDPVFISFRSESVHLF
jgi:ABC-type Fe3+/spermidine/putrescine transport system ATPase subunit